MEKEKKSKKRKRKKKGRYIFLRIIDLPIYLIVCPFSFVSSIRPPICLLIVRPFSFVPSVCLSTRPSVCPLIVRPSTAFVKKVIKYG
jgi:hypothetical protein